MRRSRSVTDCVGYFLMTYRRCSEYTADLLFEPPGGAMEQGGPFRFLRRQEFEKLTPAEKIVYLDGATTELRRRGEELRSFTQLMSDWRLRSMRYRVKSPLSGNNK